MRDRERVVGVVRIEDLLAAEAGVTLRDLMDADAPTVAPGAKLATLEELITYLADRCAGRRRSEEKLPVHP